jgi:hypothetical protein
MIAVVLPFITFTKTIWLPYNPNHFKIVETPLLVDNITQSNEIAAIDWYAIFVSIYLAIASLLLLKLGIEILSFYKKIKNKNRQKLAEYTLIASAASDSPFSFFNYIVINPTQFSGEELNHIIAHEAIHVKQNHSVDVLLTKIFCALFWINPVIYLYRKAILQNLEFIADHDAFEILKNKFAYQKTLLKVVLNEQNLSITNQFYQSLIKKRIVMLNTNPSPKRNSWKYTLVLPTLLAFFMNFQIETVAQIQAGDQETVSHAVSTSYSSMVTKNSTNQELTELEETFSGQNQKLIISNVNRNNEGEIIEIKLMFDTGKTYHRVFHRKSNKPIDDIQIFVKTDDKGNKDCGFKEIEAADLEAIWVKSDEPKEKFWSMDNMKKNGKDVVLIINGKINGAAEKVKIPLDEEMDIMKEISASEFEKKYKQKADKNKYYYEVETVKVKTVFGSWDDLKTENKKIKTAKTLESSEEIHNNTNRITEVNSQIKIVTEKLNQNIGTSKQNNEADSENPTNNFDKLLIINGKAYLPNEIAKGTTLKSDYIIELNSEEGFKRYGEKGKNGVLILEGKTEIISKEKAVKQEIKELKRIEKLRKKEEKMKVSEEKETIEKNKKMTEEQQAKIEQKKSK